MSCEYRLSQYECYERQKGCSACFKSSSSEAQEQKELKTQDDRSSGGAALTTT